MFQGRFKAILVDTESYLLEVCRYVELNPVRANMVRAPGEWPWSSYLANICHTSAPPWLDTSALHAYLLGHDIDNTQHRQRAADMYVDLVESAHERSLWEENLRQQIYLGDEAFIERMQALAEPKRRASREIPSLQLSSPKTLTQWLNCSPTREEALLCAHEQSGISMADLARELGLSLSRVSRLVGRARLRINSQRGAIDKT